MPRLRRLSGHHVIQILAQFGFAVVSQRGSHAKLRRSVAGANQVLTIPVHAELDKGTLRAIITVYSGVRVEASFLSMRA
jgi:predicted RNA binding protein YcfA (HicA-like mRNA interferase family)